MLISQGRLDQAERALEASAARTRYRDPARAAVMLCGAAFVQANQCRMAAAVATAETAVALAGPLGGASAAVAEWTLGWVLIGTGEGARGYPLLLRHIGPDGDSRRTREGIQASAQLGMLACWMVDYETARHELERAVAVARDRGLVNSLPLALSALGELEFRVGNWIAALAHADAALRLGEEAGEFRHYGHVLLLLLNAVKGDADGARTYADIVLTTADRTGSQSLAMHAHAGLGLLQLGLDDPEAAIVHLSRTREIAERGAFEEPNVVQWMGDLIESQLRAGLEPEARSTLAAFESQARRTGRAWALAAAARCRGLLAQPDTADAVFAEAHRLVAAQPSPFERARTELCFGERLRRDGHRVAARRHLARRIPALRIAGGGPLG